MAVADVAILLTLVVSVC